MDSAGGVARVMDWHADVLGSSHGTSLIFCVYIYFVPPNEFLFYFCESRAMKVVIIF